MIDGNSKDLTDAKKQEIRTKYTEMYWLQGLKVGKLDILIGINFS